jgi:uncharacterized protein
MHAKAQTMRGMANAQPGNFVWYDHLTKDPRAATGFYGEVVGWKTQPFDNNPDYLMWVASQGPLGGLMPLPAEAAKMGAPPHWMGHVCVANVDETVAKVKELGGKVHTDPSDIPTVGRFAVIADPQGATISVFTPKDKMELHDLEKEGEFCWNELMTSDLDAAWGFYEKIFGWKKMDDMDMGALGTYRLFGVGEKQLGGMMKIPSGAPMPTAWNYYAQVADIEAAVGRATKQGAKVLNGPMDVPGGGRVAVCMDPQGAAFAMHQNPPKK